MSVPWSPSRELGLLLQCARPSQAKEHAERVRSIVSEGLDWYDLTRRAAWHRMLPLLQWHLSAACPGAVPTEIRDALASEFRRNAHWMLRLTGELTTVLSSLRERGVPALPYKGPLLGKRLYNNLALRTSVDLDILVRRRDVVHARDFLIAYGYQPQRFVDEAKLSFMLANRYSETLLRDGVRLELHWALTNRDIPITLDCDALLERAQTARIGGVELRILANDDLALVLCVHGAKHRWNRLEWIAGLATLTRAVPELKYEALLARARELHAYRRVLLGLLVAHDVLDAPTPNDVVERARADKTLTELSNEVCQSLDALPGRSAQVERAASLPFDWFHLRLADSLQDKLRLVVYRLTTPSKPELWNTISWGKRLLPLHAVLRPLQVALRLGPAAWSFIRERNARHDSIAPLPLGVHHDTNGLARAHSRRRSDVRAQRDAHHLRILQLVQKPQRRGAEIFAHDFNRWAQCQGHYGRMVYLYPHAGATSLPLVLGDVVLGRDEQHWSESVPSVNPRIMRRLKENVEEFEPDIIVLNGSRTVKYGALLRVLEPRSNWKLVYRNIDSPKFWLRGAARTAFYRRVVMPRVDAVIGISQQTLSEVVSVYRLRVPHIFVPNAVDFDQLRRGGDGGDVRAATRTPADAIVALFIGHLSRQKRPDRFLRVLQRAVREVPNVYGWLLGDGPDRVALEAQARELGIEQHVRFLGYQEKVAPYVAASDMYVSSSDTEGLPTVVIEAGYLGKPTVAMLVGGMDECVRDGETGLLAARDDEQRLVNNLVRLARDPRERKRMGEKARAWMAEEFAMSRVGEEYLAFFASLLGGATLGRADTAARQQPTTSPNEEGRLRRRAARKRAAPQFRG